MSDGRDFVVLGAGEGLTSQVLLALHVGCRPRHCTVVCRSDGQLLHYGPYADRRIMSAFDGSDDAAIEQALARLLEERPELLAIPADCEGAALLNRLQDRLPLSCVPFPGAHMLSTFDDKWAFYRLARSLGLAVPDTLHLASKHACSFHELARLLGAPVVVKPLREQASAGLRIIADEPQWREQILADEDYRYQPLIAQRHIAGTDIGINLLAVHGEIRALAMQQRDFPQGASARIRFFHSEALEVQVRRLCAASGYHGVMNIDARVESGSGDVYFFECNPRFWQSLSASVWCGLNFVQKCCELPERPSDDSRLCTGTADTWHHPLFRPALLGWACLPGGGPRPRMARLMLRDLDLLRRGMKERLRSRSIVRALLRQGQRGVLATMQVVRRA